MNRLEKLALATTIAVTILNVWGFGSVAYAYYLDQIRGGDLPIWAAGTMLATYGPIAAAVLFWRWAKKSMALWTSFVLFLLCAIGLFRGGETLMLAVIEDPDFDAMFGAPIMPATLLLMVAVTGFFAAVIARRRLLAKDRPNVR